MPKLSELWPGDNRFFCKCCVTGPSRDLPGIIYIYVCTLIALIPFCIFVVGDNWNVTPALPLILFISLACMYFFLYLTSCTDPGIIPRRPFLELTPDKYQKFLTSMNPNARVCDTCHIFRPKRTSHCSSCGNCV